MHVLLIVLGLLGGFAAPASLAAITPLQWGLIAYGAASNGKDLIKLDAQMRQLVESPAFRIWVAANGARAIQLQPGIETEK